MADRKVRGAASKKVDVIGDLMDMRLISETARLVFQTEGRFEFKTKAYTTVNLSVGIASANDEQVMAVQCKYSAAVLIVDTGEKLLEYESEHVAHFRLVKPVSVDPSFELTESVVHPYTTLVGYVAKERAQGTFAAMGTTGLVLPLPRKFGSRAVAPLEATKASDTATVAPKQQTKRQATKSPARRRQASSIK